MNVSHIRAKMPHRGGNSFYRDTRDLSASAVTLCGAPITDRDISYHQGGFKAFRLGGTEPVCRACQLARSREATIPASALRAFNNRHED